MSMVWCEGVEIQSKRVVEQSGKERKKEKREKNPNWRNINKESKREHGSLNILNTKVFAKVQMTLDTHIVCAFERATLFIDFRMNNQVC